MPAEADSANRVFAVFDVRDDSVRIRGETHGKTGIKIGEFDQFTV